MAATEWRGREEPALAGIGDEDTEGQKLTAWESWVPVNILQGIEEGPEGALKHGGPLPVFCCMKFALQPRGWVRGKELFLNVRATEARQKVRQRTGGVFLSFTY